MNHAFFNQYQPDRGPLREQNLFISLSKHLYLTKDGYLRRQAKPIDPRIPGPKQLLTRLAVLDVDTGSVYGEFHNETTAKDLIGFLARAWSKKTEHPMKGVPKLLNVPAVALTDESYRDDLEFAVRHTGLLLGKLPSGFAAGANALKQLEHRVAAMQWRADDIEIDLEIIHSTAAAISVEASDSFSHMWAKRWEAVAPVDPSFLEAVDALYQTPGVWRSGPYELVLKGLLYKA